MAVDSLINLALLCKNNEAFLKIKNIIEEARKNPPKEGHIHHIIPRSWYKIHNFKVDNRKTNKVLVTVEDHYKLHLLLSECMKEKEMQYRMRYAAHGLKNWKKSEQKPISKIPSCTTNISENNEKKQHITKVKHVVKKSKQRTHRGVWRKFLNNHIENIKNCSNINEQIEYLSKLKPQIEYQVSRRILENSLGFSESHEFVKKLRKKEMDRYEVLSFINNNEGNSYVIE